MRTVLINVVITAAITLLTLAVATPRVIHASAAALYGEALYLQPIGQQERVAMTELVVSQTGERVGYGLYLQSPGGAERVRVATLNDGSSHISVRDSANRVRISLAVYPDGTPSFTCIEKDYQGLAVPTRPGQPARLPRASSVSCLLSVAVGTFAHLDRELREWDPDHVARPREVRQESFFRRRKASDFRLNPSSGAGIHSSLYPWPHRSRGVSVPHLPVIPRGRPRRCHGCRSSAAPRVALTARSGVIVQALRLSPAQGVPSAASQRPRVSRHSA
jgi:hypothetical protein